MLGLRRGCDLDAMQILENMTSLEWTIAVISLCVCQASDVSHALKLHVSTPSPHPSSPKWKTADDRGASQPRGRRVGGCFSHSYTTPITKQARKSSSTEAEEK